VIRRHFRNNRELGQAERRTSRRLRFRLRRQLFWWAGLTIIMTGTVTFAVVHALAPASPFREDISVAARTFVARRFAEVWERPEQRRALARELSQTFRLNVTLTDDSDRELLQVGEPCRGPESTSAVLREGRALGSVRVCFDPGRRFGGPILLAGLLAAIVTLWAASAWFARRLSRPFIDLVRVTREIGDGRLSSRMQLGRHQVGEAAVLAEAINDMAARIERQIEGQRELLAAVSHELRTPLTRLRVLVELADQQGQHPETHRKIEREVLEIDALVGKLLANSRLDFEVLEFQKLEAADLARRALERAGLDAGLLDDKAEGASFEGDATLLTRALGNLIENAEHHAGAVERVAVVLERQSVRFEVLDRGPGFSEALRTRAFEPFVRGSFRGSAPHGGAALGLGLSLVARIARAHGGRAFAENRAEGGARVVLELPLERPGPRGRTADESSSGPPGGSGIDSSGRGR
jgi:signal transduction histidine kinase